MNYFKLYIGDYQRDTAHLSVVEHGAFLLMLQHFYATEKPLPSGKALHRMLRAQDKAERDAIDAVAVQFWRDTGEGLVNDRALSEITKAKEQAETNARIVKAREEKRKAARQQHDESTNRATNTEPIHSHSHNQKDEKKRRAQRKTLLPPDFAISERVRRWATEKGHSRLAEHFEYFVGNAKARGATYADWDEAFMNAIRGNWASLKEVPHETHQRVDNSAVARVHRATAAVLEPESGREALADHDGNVWPQVVERIR